MVCVCLRQVIEFYYNYGQNDVKPYNPVKSVNVANLMNHNHILERDAPIVQDSYGQVSKLKRGDAFRVGENYYVVVGDDYFVKKEKIKKIPNINPYKDFYRKKMRPIK